MRNLNLILFYAALIGLDTALQQQCDTDDFTSRNFRVPIWHLNSAPVLNPLGQVSGITESAVPMVAFSPTVLLGAFLSTLNLILICLPGLPSRTYLASVGNRHGFSEKALSIDYGCVQVSTSQDRFGSSTSGTG